jgi:hypothetical protein
LPRHALSEYTASMRSRALGFSLFLSAGAASLAAQGAPPREPRELLAALDRVRLDPAATYKVESSNRIELRRGDGKLLFEDGFLTFFSPLDGKVTGVVFSGRGHILATPRDPVEKQQLARFLGAPVLDQDFTTAYIRFTDQTADELQRELQTAQISASSNSAFTDAWQQAVTQRNPAHSLRIFSDYFSNTPRPYFVATLGGVSSGPFEFVFDQAREEPQMFGQGKKAGDADYYDIWASYRLPETSPTPAAFHALKYKIETAIHSDNALSGEATVRIQANRAGERLVPFGFSHLLAIDVATLSGQTLFTFPDGDTPPQERASRANEFLYVLLPRPSRSGEEFEITLRYHGNVIRDAGNGVLFVGARESWYPHLGDTAEYSAYDLTFRWPHKLRLAATGLKIDEAEEGDTRTGHWRTEKPASVAGFNLGEYVLGALAGNGYSIDVYANRQLEQALLDRLRSPITDGSNLIPRPFGSGSRVDRLNMPLPEPRPADALKQLAKDIDSSIRFYEMYSGPFPVRQLNVSQIPGTFGQGWPGLLYLSTYSFLPAEAQQRAGLSASGQEHFHDLVPFHEVAHQWWGNVVGWSSYRDQWIDEALATYLSLLFADSQKSPDHRLHVWLDRFRKRLLEKDSTGMAPADVGSLALGSRLSSSKTPDGFDQLVYGKGAWIFHMLRELLKEPSAKNPDLRFITLLHTLQTKYAYRALSSNDLQREVEAAMTTAMNLEGRRSMEWFFADWVRGTGIPHYRLEYSVKHSEKGFIVKGKLLQSGVADSFVAPVPIYSSNGGYLGRVVAGGGETPFHFISAREPGKLLIDPQMTLLCVIDRN